MKKFLFIIFVLLSGRQIFGTVADILNEDPWRVLQYKFVTKPEKKANSWKNIGIKGIVTVGSGIGSFGLCGLAHAYLFDHKFRFKYWPKPVASRLAKGTYYPVIPLSLISSLLSCNIANHLMVKKYQKQELLDFLKNWDDYKKHIPGALIDKLNIVRQQYLQNKVEIEDQADEITEVIESQINLHFYGDPKARNLFDMRILTANFNTHFVLDIAKIIKSLVGAYQVYNGNDNGSQNRRSRN